MPALGVTMSEGPKYDVIFEIVLQRAPKGSGKNVGIFMSTFSRSGKVSADGHTLRYSIESRHVPRIHFNMQKLFPNEGQAAWTFTSGGQVIEPGPYEGAAEETPKPLSPELQAMADALAAKRGVKKGPQKHRPQGPGQTSPQSSPTGASPTMPHAEGHQGAPLSHPMKGFPGMAAPTAADVRFSGPPPKEEDDESEGIFGTWSFGNGYRPVDEAKIHTVSRMRRARRDGKYKVTLGLNSDRSYLVEPLRGGSTQWRTSKLEPDGSRTPLGDEDEWEDAVLLIRGHERAKAKVSTGGPGSTAGTADPSTEGPASTSTAGAAGPSSGVTSGSEVLEPALHSSGGAPGTGSVPHIFLISAGKAPARWTVVSTSTQQAFVGEDLEDTIAEAFATLKVSLGAFTWDGGLPDDSPTSDLGGELTGASFPEGEALSASLLEKVEISSGPSSESGEAQNSTEPPGETRSPTEPLGESGPVDEIRQDPPSEELIATSVENLSEAHP